jgi:hypothetical protein
MTFALHQLAPAELIRLISDAATELERRGSSSPDPRPAQIGPAASSPVVPRRCNLCNAPVVLALTEKNGEWIPLDETEGGYELVNGKARWVNAGGSHAFHYDNCPGSAQNKSEKYLFDELTEELGLRHPDSVESVSSGVDA